METKTQKIIKTMLKENTGKHFLDSGGENGRQWQRNKGRKFDKDPRASVEFSIYQWKEDPPKAEINVTRSLYHFLCENLEFDPAMDRRFQNFQRKHNEDSDFENMAAFVTTLEGATGLYGEGDPITENSYNGESNLSQVIQFTYFEFDNQGYCILQIHGGADVRGGYTTPKVFRCDIGNGFLHFSEAQISCTNGHNWSTDDNYHWYQNAACGLGAGMQLEKYPPSDKPEAGKLGIVDGKGYCPLCAAELQAS